MFNVRLSNKTDGDIHYIDKGKGDVLLLLHGGPGLVHDYLNMMYNELLLLGYRVITFDQRGNGLSSLFEVDEVTITNIVEDIEALRLHLALRQSIYLPMPLVVLLR